MKRITGLLLFLLALGFSAPLLAQNYEVNVWDDDNLMEDDFGTFDEDFDYDVVEEDFDDWTEDSEDDWAAYDEWDEDDGWFNW